MKQVDKNETVYSQRKCELQIVEIICNNSPLKEMLTNTLKNCNNVRKNGVRYERFQNVGYDSLVSLFSTKLEKRLAKNCKLM